MEEDVMRDTFYSSEYKEKTSTNQDSSQVEWSTSFGTFRKRVLHPGKGYRKPGDLGTKCIVTMTVTEVFSNLDFGYPVGVNVTLQTGEGDTEMAEVIDKCICSMRECEICTLSITNGHVNFGKLLSSEADSEINTSTSEIQNESVVTIELKSFENRHIWNLSMEQKFSVAKNHKVKGVELFQTGNFEHSFKRFSKSLRYLISMTPNSLIPSSVCSEFKLLRCQCYLNLAACQLKYNNFNAAKANCTKALNIEPQNVKGLYRRAQAYLEQGDFYNARNDLLTAIKIEPGNKVVKSLLTQVKQRQEEQS